jgi:hypothetical protein
MCIIEAVNLYKLAFSTVVKPRVSKEDWKNHI